MKLSVAIMAHPDRERFIPELERQLPGCRVVWDQKNNRWDTGRRSLLAYDEEADWHLVVQDDVILCDDFLERVTEALSFVREGPVALYMGKGTVDGVPAKKLVRRGRQAGYRWVKGDGPLWGPAVAIRPEDIPPLVAWCDARKKPDNYDLRMTLYFRKHGRRCWYAMPSLVEHRIGDENPSLVAGRGANRGRIAAWFEQDPSEYFPWNGNSIDLEPRRPKPQPKAPPTPTLAETRDPVCAVLVAAYKAAPFLEWALESIDQQLQLDGWQYEVRIAVDACPETAALLGRLGRPFYWSPVNVGPYVLRNSLAALHPAAAYATFDADDQMKPQYLSTLIPLAVPDGIAGASRLEVESAVKIERLARARRPMPWHSGVSVYSFEAWESLGGFRPWRVAADQDLIMRAKAKGIPCRMHTGTPRALYYRRVHPGQLTQDEQTGRETPARLEQKRKAEALVAAGDIDIKVETVDLELVDLARAG